VHRVEHEPVVVSSTGTRICICSMPPPPTRMLNGNTSGCPTAQSSSSSAVALEQPALDDAVLELVEADLDVLRWNDAGARSPAAAEELEVAAVQALDVVRVDRVLHDLHQLHGSVAVPMSRTPSITNTSKRGSCGAGSGPT
jgi:hypothetical protein